MRPLSSERAETLRRQPFTYAEVGATRDTPPVDARRVERRLVLRRRDFSRAADELKRWQVQRRAGLRPTVSSDIVEPDAVVVMTLGIGGLGVVAPCRIVYIEDHPDRQGFAYGTLPGHPESGEEAFVLTRAVDGRITFTISAFSRPASRLARVSGPAGRLVQDAITNRYLQALDR